MTDRRHTSEQIRDAMLVRWTSKFGFDTSNKTVVYQLFDIVAEVIAEERDEAIRRAVEPE